VQTGNTVRDPQDVGPAAQPDPAVEAAEPETAKEPEHEDQGKLF